MQRHATLIALAAALIASVALAIATGKRPPVEAADDPALEAPSLRTAPELEALTLRVEKLATDLAMARTELATLRGQGREPAVAGVDPGVERRLAELEKAIGGAVPRAIGRPPEGMVAVFDADGNFVKFDDDDSQKGRRRDGRSLDDWTNQALDPAASEEEKLQALRGLRGERLADGSDARSPAVVAEMIAIGEGSGDASSRADAWRQLSGARDPQLVSPLLASLANDPDAKVREEAAETLGDFLPDMNVKSALQYALQHDSDEGVRKQAAESLY